MLSFSVDQNLVNSNELKKKKIKQEVIIIIKNDTDECVPT